MRAKHRCAPRAGAEVHADASEGLATMAVENFNEPFAGSIIHKSILFRGSGTAEVEGSCPGSNRACTGRSPAPVAATAATPAAPIPPRSKPNATGKGSLLRAWATVCCSVSRTVDSIGGTVTLGVSIEPAADNASYVHHRQMHRSHSRLMDNERVASRGAPAPGARTGTYAHRWHANCARCFTHV